MTGAEKDNLRDSGCQRLLPRGYKEIDNLPASAYLRWSHASMVQSGIALESLGYLVDVQQNIGAHLNNRKQMNFKPG